MQRKRAACKTILRSFFSTARSSPIEVQFPPHLEHLPFDEKLSFFLKTLGLKQLKKTQQVFEKFSAEEKHNISIVDYNRYLKLLCEEGKIEDAENIFGQLTSLQKKPTNRTYTALLTHYLKKNDEPKIRKTLNLMTANNLPLDRTMRHLFAKYCCDVENLQAQPKRIYLSEKEGDDDDNNIFNYWETTRARESMQTSTGMRTGPSNGDGMPTPFLRNNYKFSSIFQDSFFESLGVGGISEELRQLFRRAFASRFLPPQLVSRLQIDHVKGILLHGPPGCGKTLVARKIGEILNCHEPKIVNGPEIFSKWMGDSEKNIRDLFDAAEKEYELLQENSQIHLIILDEIDAIAKHRGTHSSGSSNKVEDNVVNQLLTKLDGVKKLNNVLVIATTNRIDLLDEALLRPGRFDIKIEVGLPDEVGRLQILKIHSQKLQSLGHFAEVVRLEDLARKTQNYTGAELRELIASSFSHAANRLLLSDDVTSETVPLKITKSDIETSLREVRPFFGSHNDELLNYQANKLIYFHPSIQGIMNSTAQRAKLLLQSQHVFTQSLLILGERGAGKSTLSAHLAGTSSFPFIKFISSQSLNSSNEVDKATKFQKVTQDAYKSQHSCVVLDDFERLIDFVPIGPRFSNVMLQQLMDLLRTKPPKQGHKLFIIMTTSLPKQLLAEFGILGEFKQIFEIPKLETKDQFNLVTKELGCSSEAEGLAISDAVTVKNFIEYMELVR